MTPRGGVIWLNNKKGGTKIPYLANIIDRFLVDSSLDECWL